MVSFTRITVILFSIVLLSACGAAQVKVGRDFDVNAFSTKIQQGVTTQAQITSWLGEPTSVGVNMDYNGERFDEWDYYFAEGKLAEMSNAKVKVLRVVFDHAGAVRSYNWSASKQ